MASGIMCASRGMLAQHHTRCIKMAPWPRVVQHQVISMLTIESLGTDVFESPNGSCLCFQRIYSELLEQVGNPSFQCLIVDITDKNSITHTKRGKLARLPVGVRGTKTFVLKLSLNNNCGKRGAALDSRSSGPCLSPGQGWHCVACVIGQDTLLSQYLAPPRSVNRIVPHRMLGSNLR